jgi:malonate decarboxylase beta subunit
VLCAAEEPAFMGGSVGEVHGAKLTGLLERAARDKPDGVLLVLDTGGVRLHEANAGLIAISEIQRAVFKARRAGVPVIVVSAGSNGCYGGLGIVSRCCDHVVMTEEGRLSVSGPEVIESQKGVEEFDARDRALVWRTMGGKHRYLLGEATAIVNDSTDAIRATVAGLFAQPVPLDLEQLLQEHGELARRLDRFGDSGDALDIWRRMGIEQPERIPALDHEAFVDAARAIGKTSHA